ncbi:MAG: tripartite tricarboxylate transporter TctB family protein [Thermodesulfobacteriota bacterium]
MKRPERIAALTVVIGGLAVVYHGYAVLKLGSVFQPDAGFLPFLSGIALVVLGFCWFVGARGLEDREKSFFEKGRWFKPALAMGMMLVYAWAMEAAGYITSTLGFMVAWQLLVERERWLKTIWISLLGTFAMVLLFSHFLKVPVPREFFLR